MKTKLASLLAATGIIAAYPANASLPTITAADIQAYGVMITALKSSYSGTQLKDMAQGVVNAISSNPGLSVDIQPTQNNLNNLTSAQLNATYTLTSAEKAQVDSTWNAAIDPSNLTPVLSVVNSTAQSTSACSTMGTYPSSITSASENSIRSCSTAIQNALAADGLTSDAANVAATFAMLKALGIPANILGAAPITVREVVVPQIQRATSIQQATIISNVVSNIFSTRASLRPGAQMRMSLGEEKGMAAGDSPAKLNVWLNASDSSIGNSATTSSFGGNVSNVLGGVDYMFSPQLVAGVSLGYDQVSLDYHFSANSGLTSAGWMVAPYASYKVNDMVSVDGAYGYASGDSDNRTSGVTTTQGYTRNFFALNLNGDYWMGNWQLTGKANYINAEEKDSSASNKMEQLRLGGQVGYWADGVMPYASITYVNDLKVSSSIAIAPADKEAWVAAIGINLFSKGAIYGGVSYIHEFERQDSKNDTIMANIGYRF